MSPIRVIVRVPASSANLGPGFDCIALALDLWNQAEFSLEGNCLQINVTGEGKQQLSINERNLVARSFAYFYQSRNEQLPSGIRIDCHNNIPLSSGLGSSAAASLLGLMGANALLGSPATLSEILQMAIEMEGHPDNASAALYGGLVVVSDDGSQLITHSIQIPELHVVIVIPQMRFPTHLSRAALPTQLSLKDTVYNMAHTALVVEALRSNDLDLLGKSMKDRLHQPYRLPLIPGAETSSQAALQAGASAVCISGAGPGLIAFINLSDPVKVADAMCAAFTALGTNCEHLILTSTNQGAHFI
jgi:homoserine kinase